MKGQQVVCIDLTSERYCGMPVGAIFTVESVEASGIQQQGRPNSDFDYLSIKGYTGKHYRMRFKPLEEMQNTNFIELTK